MPRKSRKRRYHDSCVRTAKRWRKNRRHQLGLSGGSRNKKQTGCIACGNPLDYVRSDDWYCSDSCATYWREKRIDRQVWHDSRRKLMVVT